VFPFAKYGIKRKIYLFGCETHFTPAHSYLVDRFAIIGIRLTIFWLFAAGISVMAFDSGVTREAWTFVIVVWSYPIWPIVFASAAWIAYARKKDRLAGILTTRTFLPVLVLLLIIVLSNVLYSFRL
jgi:hypothetical protein